MRLMVEIFMNSLRDVFPEGAVNNPSVEEFQKSLDIPDVAYLIEGVYEANKDLFTPLTRRFQGLKDAMDQAISSLKANLKTSPSPNSSESEPSKRPDSTESSTQSERQDENGNEKSVTLEPRQEENENQNESPTNPDDQPPTLN